MAVRFLAPLIVAFGASPLWANCWLDGAQICRAQIKSYSEEIFVLSNSASLAPPSNSAPPVQTAVLLHGFSFNSDRDRDLMAILKDLELPSVVEAKQEPWRLIIPWSPGKNRTYRAELTHFNALWALLSEVHQVLNLPVPASFHLWAHSGAYKTVTDVLSTADRQVLGLRLLDATYRAFDDSKLLNWLAIGGPKVEVAWLKGSATHPKAEDLRSRYGNHPNWKFSAVDPSQADHWSLVPLVLRKQ